MRMYKHYSKDGDPTRCPHCGNGSFTDHVRDSIEGVISETSITCKRCHNEVGCWAYGYYDPAYYTVKGFNNILHYILLGSLT